MDIRGIRISDREMLIGRFGLGAAAASRVVSLLAEGTDITESVLRAAPPGSAIESLLMDPDFPAPGDPRAPEDMMRAARRHGCDEGRLPTVVESPDGWRTIAFEDEITPAPEATSLSGPLVRFDPAGQLTYPERDELFSPGDVAALKMEALTGRDPRERIEAVRKIVYAPGAEREKAGLFIGVLNDITADDMLKREALRALEQIGLDPDLAEALRVVLLGEESSAIAALKRIAFLLEGADDAETGVVLAVLLEHLDRVKSPDISVELMGLITARADVLCRNCERLEHFLRTGIRHLNSRFLRMHRSVSEAFRACYETDPETVVQFLNIELERASDPFMKGFLIRRIIETGDAGVQVRALADIAVKEFMSEELREEERSYLRGELIRLGEPAALAVEERLAHSTGRTRAELVSLLDMLCARRTVSGETLERVLEAMLKLLKVGERSTRRRILESSVFGDPRIPADLRGEIAAELLSHIAEFELANTREDIYRSLQRLGPPAIPAILHYLKVHFPQEATAPVFLTLGRIAQTAGARLGGEPVREAIDFCMEIFDRPRVRQGKFCIALAWLCGYSNPGVDHIDRLLKNLRQKAWKTEYSFDIIEALSILAGSPNTGAAHQQYMFETFSRISTLQTDAAMGTEKEGEDGTVFEFGRGIHFETVVIPLVIKGLERMMTCPGAAPELRAEVVKRLLVLWEGVSHMRLVWSPTAVETLVNAIGTVASSGYIDDGMRARLGRALLDHMNKTSVVINLARICSAPDAGEEMTEASITAAERLVEEWERSRDEDMERRAALLKSLGSIAANSALESDNLRVSRMRELALETLFQGLRAGVPEAGEPLKLMRECEGLDERRRTEIQARLDSVFGPAPPAQ